MPHQVYGLGEDKQALEKRAITWNNPSQLLLLAALPRLRIDVMDKVCVNNPPTNKLHCQHSIHAHQCDITTGEMHFAPSMHILKVCMQVH
jgi:hypothetical protein